MLLFILAVLVVHFLLIRLLDSHIRCRRRISSRSRLSVFVRLLPVVVFLKSVVFSCRAVISFLISPVLSSLCRSVISAGSLCFFFNLFFFRLFLFNCSFLFRLLCLNRFCCRRCLILYFFCLRFFLNDYLCLYFDCRRFRSFLFSFVKLLVYHRGTHYRFFPLRHRVFWKRSAYRRSCRRALLCVSRRFFCRSRFFGRHRRLDVCCLYRNSRLVVVFFFFLFGNSFYNLCFGVCHVLSSQSVSKLCSDLVIYGAHMGFGFYSHSIYLLHKLFACYVEFFC